MRVRGLLLLLPALFAGAGGAQAATTVVEQRSGVDVRLRGISAVDADVAWASGQKGTVLRTVDGGAHWRRVDVPGAEALDFRDIEGFDADTAVALSIGPGDASRVYRTHDGGKTWTLVLHNRDPRAFFDCMAFEGQRGWMLGDPVDGRFQVYETRDGGRHWRLMQAGPQAAEGEAAFAASGTCIAIVRGAPVVATGGAVARLHVLSDGRWVATNASLAAKGEARGYFSVAASGAGAIAVGGDYKAEAAPGMAASTSSGAFHSADDLPIESAADREGSRVDRSKQPGIRAGILSTLHEQVPPPRYRSGIACVGNRSPCAAVGPSGVDVWNDDRWHHVESAGYDAIDLAGNRGWVSGDKGRIARINLVE